MRLALLLAVTDARLPAPRRVIEAEHLRMALAWWDQFQAPSSLHVWGQEGVVTSTKEDQAEREADTPDRSRFQRRAERVYTACQQAGAAGLDYVGQRRALSNRAQPGELKDIRDYLVKRELVRVEEQPTGAGGQKRIVIIAI